MIDIFIINFRESSTEQQKIDLPVITVSVKFPDLVKLHVLSKLCNKPRYLTQKLA